MAEAALSEPDDIVQRPWYVIFESDRQREEDAERRHETFCPNMLPERQRETLAKNKLNFPGLVGPSDPVREEVPAGPTPATTPASTCVW